MHPLTSTTLHFGPMLFFLFLFGDSPLYRLPAPPFFFFTFSRSARTHFFQAGFLLVNYGVLGYVTLCSFVFLVFRPSTVFLSLSLFLAKCFNLGGGGVSNNSSVVFFFFAVSVSFILWISGTYSFFLFSVFCFCFFVIKYTLHDIQILLIFSSLSLYIYPYIDLCFRSRSDYFFLIGEISKIS